MKVLTFLIHKNADTSFCILNACRLLCAYDTLEICIICYRAGFNSVANFNRHFKRLTGYTPTDYRSLIDNKGHKWLVA